MPSAIPSPAVPMHGRETRKEENWKASDCREGVRTKSKDDDALVLELRLSELAGAHEGGEDNSSSSLLSYFPASVSDRRPQNKTTPSGREPHHVVCEGTQDQYKYPS